MQIGFPTDNPDVLLGFSTLSTGVQFGFSSFRKLEFIHGIAFSNLVTVSRFRSYSRYPFFELSHGIAVSNLFTVSLFRT